MLLLNSLLMYTLSPNSNTLYYYYKTTKEFRYVSTAV